MHETAGEVVSEMEKRVMGERIDRNKEEEEHQTQVDSSSILFSVLIRISVTRVILSALYT